MSFFFPLGLFFFKRGSYVQHRRITGCFSWSSASTHKASFSLPSAGVWHVCEACGLPSILTHLGSGGPPPPPTKPNIKARLHHSSLEHVTSLSRAREAPGDISPLLLEMVTILLPKPTSLQSNAEPRRPISEKRTFTRLSETTAQTLGSRENKM